MRDFDAIIVGAGQAGPPLAGRLTGAGMTVALIERKFVGGTCVNAGCMPTKTLVASARAAHVARRADDFGIRLGGEVGVDMSRVKARADTVTLNARRALEDWLGGMERLTLLRGQAKLIDAGVVDVGAERLRAPRIFLNVGGRPSRPDFPGVDEVETLNSTTILMLDRVPEHLVVIGGSYVGLEFAQMYRRFGAEVTVVERAPRLVAREDEDVSLAIEGFLAAEGIAIRTGADCIGFASADSGVAVRVEHAAGAPQVVGSHVLLAIGRRPNTDDLGLDAAGVATDDRGFIVVDEQLQSSVPGIWALGDCNRRGAFTHTSYNDFEIVAANLLDGEDRKVGDRIPAYALYTDPPLGRVGLSERAARERGRPILVANRPMARVGRAIEKSETAGFMKVVADAETEQILGAAILGVEGDEAIHGLIDAMSGGMDARALRWAVPIHPTISELIPSLVASLAPA